MARPKRTDSRLEWMEDTPGLTWGERFHIAYKRASRKHDLNQERVQELARKVKWVSFAGLISGPESLASLDDLEGTRKRPDWLENAYIALVIMGYDPASFGINQADLQSEILKQKTTLDLLIPTSPCISISSGQAA